MLTRREALQLLGAGLVAARDPSLRHGVAAQSSLRAIARPIPSSGQELPVIGLGTWQTFDVSEDPPAREPLIGVLRAFVALGGRLIDSSPMYGRSETVVGDIIRSESMRSQLFVATKVWTTGKLAGIEQMKDSMQKLRTSTVDLMQVHNLQDVDTHLATLSDWKRDGIVRYIGVTHFMATHHDAVARVIQRHRVDTIQINYSVGEREAERRLLPLALDRGVAVIANRLFAGGTLLRRLRAKPLPAWAPDISCTTWAQILLKFVVSHPAITCAIPATSKVEHVHDNMMAAQGRLPDDRLRARIATAIGE